MITTHALVIIWAVSAGFWSISAGGASAPRRITLVCVAITIGLQLVEIGLHL